MKERAIEVLKYMGRLIRILVYALFLVTIIIPVLTYIFTGLNPLDIMEKIVPETKWEKEMYEINNELREELDATLNEIKEFGEQMKSKTNENMKTL